MADSLAKAALLSLPNYPGCGSVFEPSVFLVSNQVRLPKKKKTDALDVKKISKKKMFQIGQAMPICINKFSSIC